MVEVCVCVCVQYDSAVHEQWWELQESGDSEEKGTDVSSLRLSTE